jgi:hypothetical protein
VTEEEEKPVRVVDRRMFTADGELRPGFEAEEAAEPARPELPPRREAPDAGPRGGAAGDRVTSEQFLALVSFFATNVYAALGIDPRTGERLKRREPAVAQQMIDWLAALEQKTQGNLSFEESDLLSRALYELRLAYVEAVRQPGGVPER